MKLSKRLLTVAQRVRPGSICADVGTDHGYLAAWLAKEKNCPLVYASDINRGPLEAAKRTVENYQVQQAVHLVLSDGMQSLPVERIDDIVIAGMGGDLIAQLIEAEPRVRDSSKQLILQPMTKAAELRKALYRMGFEIDREIVVEDRRFVYTVMSVYYCGKQREIDDWFALVGKVDPQLGGSYFGKLKKTELKKAEGYRKAGNHCWKEHQKLAERLELMGKEGEYGND